MLGLHTISIITVFSFIFLIAMCNNKVYSQINELIDITNATKNINQNITKNLLFSGTTNVSKESEKYQLFKRFESTPPSIVIDKESILSDYDKQTDKLKDNLDRFESTLPPSKKFIFNSTNIFNDSLNQNNNSNISKTNSINTFQISKIALDKSNDKDENNRSNANNNQILKWKGLDIAEAAKNEGWSIPPDVSLAVGPNHVIQMVHSALKIWDKSGNEVNTLFLDDFFKHDKRFSLTDPVVIYDNNTNRWFTVIMEISDRCIYGCFIDVAASTTADPNSNWNIFKVPFEDKFADYPMVGLSKDKLVFGINLYKKYLDDTSNTITKYLGTQGIVLDKNALLNNQTIKSAYYSPLYKDYFTIFPVNSLNSKCLNMEASSFDSKGYFVNKLILFKTCGTPKENVTISIQEIPVHIILPTNGIQPSINANYTEVDTGSGKPRGPVQINNTIFTGYNTRCENNESEILSCIRIIKLNTTDNSLDFRDIFVKDAHVFYPAINTNTEGKLVVVFSMSNNYIYPSGVYATIDQNLSNAEIKPVIQGNANTNVFNNKGVVRFGDYFTSVNDPSNNSVWITGEYGDKNVNAKGEENGGEAYQLHGWSTFIANIK